MAGTPQAGGLAHALQAEHPISGLVVAADLAAAQGTGGTRGAEVETGRKQRVEIGKGSAIGGGADIGAEIATGPAIGEDGSRCLRHQCARRHVGRKSLWL